MYDLKAYAVRRDGVIEVVLSGYLANSCHSAIVKDKYPGGGIVYINDPGVAQVFIEETVLPAGHFCMMVLVPWIAHVAIPDNVHAHVSIFVNGIPVAKVEVKVLEPEEYRVAALSASPADAPMGCFILPADAPLLAIYSSFFGPASKADCEAWKSGHCVAIV